MSCTSAERGEGALRRSGRAGKETKRGAASQKLSAEVVDEVEDLLDYER